MGRRCCCKEGCAIIEQFQLHFVRELAEVFNIVGNFTVDDYYGFSDKITFHGDFSLNLIYPKAIYSNDNFSIAFGGVEYDIESGDRITETITFTIGQNVLEVKSIRRIDLDVSFTIKYNNHVVYINNKGYDDFSGVLSLGYNCFPIISMTHYLIRRDNKLYYYINDTHLLCEVDDIPSNAIHFSYSWESNATNPTVTFDPYNLVITKPDKWWKRAKYQELPRVPADRLTDSDVNNLHRIYTDNEVEGEGCVSPETTLYSDRAINDTLRFPELSPKIAIQFSGFKNSKTYISGQTTTAVRYVQGTTQSELSTIYDKIRIEKEKRQTSANPEYDDPEYYDESDYGTINGLKTDIIDLDGIMTAQAAIWDDAGYEYALEWYNGGVVRLNYNSVSNQKLNGIVGGSKVVFQNMMPITVMRNSAWYSHDFTDSGELHGTPPNVFHGGFMSLHWCYNDSLGSDSTGTSYSNVPIGVNYKPTRHVLGSMINARFDPFSFSTFLNETYNFSSSSTYRSSATDTFAITDITLELRNGIIAPDINVDLSPHGVGVIDFKFYKPDTTYYTEDQWQTPHIVNVSSASNNILHYGAHYGTTTTMWYADDSNTSQELSDRDTSSPVGGYFKLQYTTGGDISADKDYLTYVLTDQFGAKSTGIITIHFTGDTLSEYVETTVEPIASTQDLPNKNDFDTVCTVKCTVPHGLTYEVEEYSNTIHITESPKTIYLYYVHDGKTCKISDLIGETATLKIPTNWIDIAGTVQDTIQATFVNPLPITCDLAHDYNLGLENSFLQSGEPDNVDHLVATVQLWENSNTDSPSEYGSSFLVTLLPNATDNDVNDSIGCFVSHDHLRRDPSVGVSTRYKGTFSYTYSFSGDTYTGEGEIVITSTNDNSILYSLGTELTTDLYGSLTFSVTKITVVYTSGLEVEINLGSIDVADYPDLVLGDLYND